MPLGSGVIAEFAVIVFSPAPDRAAALQCATENASWCYFRFPFRPDLRDAAQAGDLNGREAFGGGAVAEISVPVRSPAPGGAIAFFRAAMKLAKLHGFAGS